MLDTPSSATPSPVQLDLSWNRLGRSLAAPLPSTPLTRGISPATDAAATGTTTAPSLLLDLWSAIADHPALLHVGLESCGLSDRDTAQLESLIMDRARLLGCLHVSGNGSAGQHQQHAASTAAASATGYRGTSSILPSPPPGRVLSRLSGHLHLPGSERWRVAPACWLCDRWVEMPITCTLPANDEQGEEGSCDPRDLTPVTVETSASASASSSSSSAPPVKRERVFVAVSGNGWLLQEMEQQRQHPIMFTPALPLSVASRTAR